MGDFMNAERISIQKRTALKALSQPSTAVSNSEHSAHNTFHRHPQEGITNGAAYDTAWTARVLNDAGDPVFPECVQWVAEHQNPDGSWGATILNYHDRILSTLSAIMALKEIDDEKFKHIIQKGEIYIWENLKNLKTDDNRLIGSELLLPSLMEQAESMGLNMPSHGHIYHREYALKLKKIDESMWYSPLTTLSFSLEFLGDKVDLSKIHRVQLSNGSVANSPAATAFFLKHRTDAKALSYLKNILELTHNGSVMTVYPVDIFEYGWVMYNLLLAHLYFERYPEIAEFLMEISKTSSIGCSSESPLADADDTAVVCKVLHDMGNTINCSIFDPYYTGEYYATYTFELDPSVSTNIHVLHFVSEYCTFPNRDEIIENLVQFLRRRISHGKLIDKWHVSPYYPTSHAVFALADIDSSLAEKAISWILNTQHDNGMWGVHGGTVEETAYAVQAILYYHQYERLDLECVKPAVQYLENSSHTLSSLWIGKVLYCPTNVILSSLTSAAFMYRIAESTISSAWTPNKRGEYHFV
jgi:halimadienyl-diphosphate synthase